MRTLVIPDIHNDIGGADAIIDRETFDRVVFLGDYFDDFGDTVGAAQSAAAWLKRQLMEPNRVCLLGNHDAAYAFEDRRFRCSGWTPQKQQSIDVIMKPADWRKLQPACPVDDTYLLTHAGLHPHWLPTEGPGRDEVYDFIRLAHYRVLSTGFDDLFGAGYSRGGSLPYGGITWLDYGEFEDSPAFKQVFGHTKGGNIRKTKGGSYCLDTGLAHYAIIENDVVHVLDFPE